MGDGAKLLVSFVVGNHGNHFGERRLFTSGSRMRLNPEQISGIRESVCEVFGTDTEVWLFGSRTDDRKRGGDIDLLIVPPLLSSEDRLLRKLRLLKRLEQRLGERKLDVVIEKPGDERLIVRVARDTGIKLQ